MLRRIDSAVSRAETAHIIEWRPWGQEAPRKYRETWYRDHWLRIDDDLLTRINRDDRYYMYWHREKKVDVTKTDYEPSLPSFTDLMQHYRANAIEDHAHLLPDGEVEGRPAHRVLIDIGMCPPETEPAFSHEATPVRAIVAVDTESDLPLRTETQALREGTWQTVLVADARYNEPVPDSLFATDFPGAKVRGPEQVAAEEKRQFRQRMIDFAVQKTVGSHTVTLRNVDGVETGDAFVAYTVSGPQVHDGATPPWQVKLQDRTEREWKPLGGGAVGRNLPALAKPWTFDGERLYVAWFRPSRRGTMDEGGNWRFTLHFTDGTDVTVSPNGQRLAGGCLPNDDIYNDLLVEDSAAFAQAARDRAEWFRDGDWRADLPILREALKGNSDASQSAVDWYKQAIEMEDRAAALTGEPADHRADWRKIADILRQSGQTAEAQAAWTKANTPPRAKP